MACESSARATPASPIVGLLLAAGLSSRFGDNKLLEPIGPGAQPMVRVCAERLTVAVDEVLALVSPAHPAVASALQACAVRVLDVPDSAAGMGHTLRAGVRATPYAAGWVVMLADMPELAPASIAAVAQALRQGASIVAPSCQGRRGHPVGFAAQWRDALEQSHGDKGARQVLQNHTEEITLIETHDPGCLIDIDTPADLARLKDRGGWL